MSISGYGAHGAYRDVAGHDLQYLSLVGGDPAPAGGRRRDRCPGTLPAADIRSSLYASLGIVIALLDKARHPESFAARHLDVAIADCAPATMEPRLAAKPFRSPPRQAP
ncbi:CoA transferase [Dactylosporangium sp. NPDC051485]|uniref:CoA transferase n=1 Tax=Dactylosporangium sp. NPDC051485 TaxID=3154846 RepID=UPI003434850F